MVINDLILLKLAENWWTIFIVFYILYLIYAFSWKMSNYLFNFILFNRSIQSFIIVDLRIIWQALLTIFTPFGGFKFIKPPSDSSINFDFIREKNNSTGQPSRNTGEEISCIISLLLAYPIRFSTMGWWIVQNDKYMKVIVLRSTPYALNHLFKIFNKIWWFDACCKWFNEG